MVGSALICPHGSLVRLPRKCWFLREPDTPDSQTYFEPAPPIPVPMILQTQLSKIAPSSQQPLRWIHALFYCRGIPPHREVKLFTKDTQQQVGKIRYHEHFNPRSWHMQEAQGQCTGPAGLVAPTSGFVGSSFRPGPRATFWGWEWTEEIRGLPQGAAPAVTGHRSSVSKTVNGQRWEESGHGHLRRGLAETRALGSSRASGIHRAVTLDATDSSSLSPMGAEPPGAKCAQTQPSGNQSIQSLEHTPPSGSPIISVS